MTGPTTALPKCHLLPLLSGSVSALSGLWSRDVLFLTHVSHAEPGDGNAARRLATQWGGSCHHKAPGSCFLVI